MNRPRDARLPVTVIRDPDTLAAALAADPGRPAALLSVGPAIPAPPGAAAADSCDPTPAIRHAAACACCAGRPPAAVALDRLFQARARGRAPWFDRILALAPTAAARAALDEALDGDRLTLARFRRDAPPPGVAD